MEPREEGSHIYQREGTCSITRLCECGCSEVVPRQVGDRDTEHVECEVGELYGNARSGPWSENLVSMEEVWVREVFRCIERDPSAEGDEIRDEVNENKE
jgi:hypothetical protein